MDTYYRAFVRMVTPMLIAGILTVVIFSFTLVLQEYIYTITFISVSKECTVSVGMSPFPVHGDVYNWGALIGGCLIASVPIASI